jgi:ketosteroid isomerase-like protein
MHLTDPLARALFAPMLLLAAQAAGAAATQGQAQTEALIRQQSQAFSDASASGDAATLARYLDDRVTFINESGEVATKADIVAGASPSANGVQNQLVQTGFHVQLFGDTAVTSFTDVSTVHFQGQVLHAKYLSTEVWRSTSAGWKMISSQTMAVADDPPAVKLPAAALDEYVGRYRAGPSFVFTIERRGDALEGRTGNGTPVPIEAEVKDVLFTPGQPRLRRIFQRDAQGRITGFVSRREGHDLVLRREG